jgi:dTDP-glucose 4,6-dehydratase
MKGVMKGPAQHVLITGGAGFIGSHLCELLLSRGYAVTAVDNYVTGRRANVEHLLGRPDFDLVERDVCQPLEDSGFKLIARHGLRGVLHFACPASPVDFDRIPFEILAVDSLGTQRTVDLALRHGARYVLASTSEIYGDPLEHPQKETYWGNVNTVGPRSCYDEAKRFAEAYVSTAIAHKRLDAGIVRIFNTYGPRMRPDDGRVVPELCMQALRGDPLTIHGDGEQTRSFCFVTDLIDGVIRLFESALKEPVNIGNPVERTVRDFADILLKLTDSRSSLKMLPVRQDDPRRRCPDIGKARAELGWEPRVPLEEGLKRCLDHFRRSI